MQKGAADEHATIMDAKAAAEIEKLRAETVSLQESAKASRQQLSWPYRFQQGAALVTALAALLSIALSFFSVKHAFDEDSLHNLQATEQTQWQEESEALRMATSDSKAQRMIGATNLNLLLTHSDDAERTRILVDMATLIEREADPTIRSEVTAEAISDVYTLPSSDSALLETLQRLVEFDQRSQFAPPGARRHLTESLPEVTSMMMVLLHHGTADGIKDWRGVYCVSCDFSGLNLSNYDFSDAELDYSNFSKTHAESSKWIQASCVRCDFQGAHIEKADFRAAQLTSSGFYHSHLFGANFADADLDTTDFTSADLSNADLSMISSLDAEFRYHFPKIGLPIFDCAKLHGTTFYGRPIVVLADKNFYAAGGESVPASFDGAHLQDLNLRGARIEVIYSATPESYADGVRNMLQDVGNVIPLLSIRMQGRSRFEIDDVSLFEYQLSNAIRARNTVEFIRTFGDSLSGVTGAFYGSNLRGVSIPTGLQWLISTARLEYASISPRLNVSGYGDESADNAGYYAGPVYGPERARNIANDAEPQGGAFMRTLDNSWGSVQGREQLCGYVVHAPPPK